jgi:hypothetical protein
MSARRPGQRRPRSDRLAWCHGAGRGVRPGQAAKPARISLATISYAEPFVGMGGIFLRRSTRPKAERHQRRLGRRRDVLPRAPGALPVLPRTCCAGASRAGRIRAPGGAAGRAADRSAAGRALPLPAAPGVRREDRRPELRRGFAPGRALQHHEARADAGGDPRAARRRDDRAAAVRPFIAATTGRACCSISIRRTSGARTTMASRRRAARGRNRGKEADQPNPSIARSGLRV